MHCRLIIWFASVLIAILCASGAATDAQDVVFLKKSSGDGEVKRKGQVVSWVGDVISIKGKTGVKEFDTDRLIRIETAWHGGYKDGNRLLDQYRYDEAIIQFNSALENEPREWMQNLSLIHISEPTRPY